MAKRGLKLNSLSRYSKQSPMLILEEHDHCEVPAGCGGVVLRWTNPQREIPLKLYLIQNGDLRLYIDGYLYKNQYLEIGRHTIAIEVTGFEPGYGLFMFGSKISEKIEGSEAVPNDTTVRCLSQSDGSWKYTLNEPGSDSWLFNGFDDSSWKPMIEKPLPNSDEQKRENKFAVWETLGSKELGINEKRVKSKKVWVRKEFNLSL